MHLLHLSPLCPLYPLSPIYWGEGWGEGQASGLTRKNRKAVDTLRQLPLARLAFLGIVFPQLARITEHGAEGALGPYFEVGQK